MNLQTALDKIDEEFVKAIIETRGFDWSDEYILDHMEEWIRGFKITAEQLFDDNNLKAEITRDGI